MIEQLQSYLSRQEDMGNVLILGDGQKLKGLAGYLMRAVNAGSVMVFEGKDVQALRRRMVECRIDTLMFDQGQVEFVKLLAGIRVRYLIGRIRMEEDYFGLWERFRKRAGHMYLARERTSGVTRDVDLYEVFEWEPSKNPVELSVVIPVYNVREYLEKCILTLTAWKAAYVEYLFVDDGSTDGSSALLDEYAAKDRRIRHLKKKNGGCASARNLGLKEAVGNYVGFVDGDDFVDEGMFYKLLSRAMMGGYELAYCGYLEYDQELRRARKVVNDCMNEIYVTGTYRPDYVQKLMIQTRVAIWRCIYRRDFLCREGLSFHNELPRFDDLPFKIESGFLAKSAVCVPKHLYYYRIGRPGQDVSCLDERLFVHFEIFRLLDDFVIPMKNRRLMDYLQVVKLHTHGYALKKIDRKYYRNYLRMAGAQLRKTTGLIRTLSLMMFYGGRGNIRWYLASYLLSFRYTMWNPILGNAWEASKDRSAGKGRRV